MLKVLRPFTTVNRRFSPDTTPEITPDDLLGHVVPIDILVARKFLEPVGAGAAAADEPATKIAKKTAV